MFYYYGAKAALAAAYPQPTRRVIIEPFAGSAAYSVGALIAGTADRAVLIEKDPRVVVGARSGIRPGVRCRLDGFRCTRHVVPLPDGAGHRV